MKVTKWSIVYTLLVIGALASVIYIYSALNACTVESSSVDMMKHTCRTGTYYTIK